jgi:N-acetylglucosamine transport system substrate-binding protein
VPAKAKNIPGGQEYLRIMLSKEGASRFTFVWYSPMRPRIETAFGGLAAGRVTADEFCTACQKAADETAKDPQTKKRTRSWPGPPPARAGVRCGTVSTGSSWGSSCRRCCRSR